MPRVLFASLAIPGLGGSSTAAYDLFRRLQGDGHDAHFLNLIETERAAFLEYAYGPSYGNPAGLPGVHNCWVGDGLTATGELARQIEAIEPEFVIGVGWIAARTVLHVVPPAKVVLLTGSCRSAQDLVTSRKIPDVTSLIEILRQNGAAGFPVHPGERTVYRDCRLVLTHSAQTLYLVEEFFPAFSGKIFPEPFWFAEWIADGAREGAHYARPFDRRDVDLLFVATSWDRPEKNYRMLCDLAARFSDRAVHLVGEAGQVPRSIVHHGLMAERADLFELMGRSRVLACPSLMDAAPGVLFEASVLGCNVVASRNCGNWEICHPELLADPFHTDRFGACIEMGLARRYPDQMDRFLHPSSYARLVRTLRGLANPFASRPADGSFSP
jgi:glycosyltransferase involved in cell wall biosynthesis